jgi:hypothetical protein
MRRDRTAIGGALALGGTAAMFAALFLPWFKVQTIRSAGDLAEQHVEANAWELLSGPDIALTALAGAVAALTVASLRSASRGSRMALLVVTSCAAGMAAFVPLDSDRGALAAGPYVALAAALAAVAGALMLSAPSSTADQPTSSSPRDAR